jgi:hypothetical protein
MFKNLKPVFIENSRIPGWLSKVSPVNIGAICLGPVVFCKSSISERTKRHETTHFQQCLDLLFIGTLLVYIWDYIKGHFKYKNDWRDQSTPRGGVYTSGNNKAYYRTRAEQEAYFTENDLEYLPYRKRWKWLFKYKV